MLIYETRITSELARFHEAAAALRARFISNAPVDDLLHEAERLDALYDLLQSILPKELRGASSLSRHMNWLQRRLRERLPGQCRSDIDDICEQDIPELERAFSGWCRTNIAHDQELAGKVAVLLHHQEYDSAIRKAFVILKSRLVTRFGAPENLDGVDLVNKIFGTTGRATSTLEASECKAMRDLLAGLYGVFRNEYMHHDVQPQWHEAEAIIAMIDTLLLRLERY